MCVCMYVYVVVYGVYIFKNLMVGPSGDLGTWGFHAVS